MKTSIIGTDGTGENGLTNEPRCAEMSRLAASYLNGHKFVFRASTDSKYGNPSVEYLQTNSTISNGLTSNATGLFADLLSNCIDVTFGCLTVNRRRATANFFPVFCYPEHVGIVMDMKRYYGSYHVIKIWDLFGPELWILFMVVVYVCQLTPMLSQKRGASILAAVPLVSFYTLCVLYFSNYILEERILVNKLPFETVGGGIRYAAFERNKKPSVKGLISLTFLRARPYVVPSGAVPPTGIHYVNTTAAGYHLFTHHLKHSNFDTDQTFLVAVYEKLLDKFQGVPNVVVMQDHTLSATWNSVFYKPGMNSQLVARLKQGFLQVCETGIVSKVYDVSYVDVKNTVGRSETSLYVSIGIGELVQVSYLVTSIVVAILIIFGEIGISCVFGLQWSGKLWHVILSIITLNARV